MAQIKVTHNIENTQIALDAAEIPNLAASKITSGTFADARIAASSVNQHATSFDDNKLLNDLSTLALRQSSNENKAAYNTQSMYVDVFQDSTGVTGLTNAVRATEEYMFSGTQGAVASYDYDGASTKAKTRWFNMQAENNAWYEIDDDGDSSNSNSKFVTPSIALQGSSGGYPQYSPGNTGSGTYFEYDFGSSILWNAGKYTIGKQNTWGDVNQFHFQYSTNGSDWSNVDLSNISQTGIQYSSTHNGSSASGAAIQNTTSGGIGELSAHPTDTIFTSATTFSGVPSITARYFRLTLNSMHGGTSNSNAGFGIFAPWQAPVTVSATGSFTSNNITASSSTSKMGAIITYQDYAGTNTLNTDIVLKLSADGGSNYATATLTAMPDFATGIKMAKVNDLSVTAGTSLKYKLEFANQASGSKEARIRGVSLQY